MTATRPDIDAEVRAIIATLAARRDPDYAAWRGPPDSMVGRPGSCKHPLLKRAEDRLGTGKTHG